MNNYIKFPEYISSNEFELEQESYDSYIAKKKAHSYLLINKKFYEDNQDHAFWYIDDISKIILEKYSICIYALVSLSEDKTQGEVFIGQTFEPSNNSYYSFLRFNVEHIDEQKKSVKIRLDFLKNLFNYNDGIVVYSANVDKNIIKSLFDEIKALNSQDEFKKLLFKTKYYQKQYVSYLPYVVVPLLALITYLSINYFVEKYNNDLDRNFNKQSTFLKSQINKYNGINRKIKKDIAYEKSKLKEASSISGKMYKEGK